MPARVALALQADGWFLRVEIIWAKPNPMPESVTDRPTRAHEQVFLLSKRARYYWDAEAVKEPHATPFERIPDQFRTGNRYIHSTGDNSKSGECAPRGTSANPAGRNLRSVWTISTEAFPGAHFATFPTRLVEPCILAGTSERGCCPECGAAWVRVVGRTDEPDTSAKGSRFDAGKTAARDGGDRTQEGERTGKRTLGWPPGCKCDAGDPVPCVVLDPFAGAGTVPLVAKRLGRAYIGIELNPDYARMAEDRIRANGDVRGKVAAERQEKAGQVALLEV
jgi:DNA modification methylase